MAGKAANYEPEAERSLPVMEDVPLVELSKSNPALRRLLATGKERGYITYDELNEALPEGSLTADHLLFPSLNALRNGDLAITRKKFDVTHFAKVHADRVVTTVDTFLLFFFAS